MIEKYQLPNGLSVILEPIESVVSVSAGLWIKVGSRHESKDQYGYAHFIEHLLFKGTEKYSAKDIAKIIDRVGGQHNAATNREYTCYYINVVYDHLELAVEILADMYYNSTFDVVEIEKEKNVVIEEIRMYEDTPDEFVHDLFIEKMFNGHPLSHSILGTIEHIEKATRDSLLEFYNTHYVNDNAVFVIAGNFNPDKAKQHIESSFSKSRSNNKKIVPMAVNPPTREEFMHVERNLEQIHFCLGLEGIMRNDKDRWALYLLSTILGGSMSSRLFQNVREKEGISYSIYSYHSSYSDYGLFGIYCATSPDTYLKALELIMQECHDIMEHSIDETELEDAKNFMIGNLALSLESIEVKMGQLAKNEITFGKNFTFAEIIKEINNISLDDFSRISDRIFKGKRFSLFSVGKSPRLKYKKLDLNL